MTARAEYIAGLRAIADALEADENLPLPFEGNTSSGTVFCETREEIAAWSRVMTGEKRKHIDEDSRLYGFKLNGQVHGYTLDLRIDRNEVCRRVVTGTREVTETVPDPDVEVPTVEVTRTVENVEWVCEPLLAEVAS